LWRLEGICLDKTSSLECLTSVFGKHPTRRRT
jgi:hypothetical protein